MIIIAIQSHIVGLTQLSNHVAHACHQSMIERCARAGYLPSLMALRGGPERVEIPLRIPTDSVHNSDLHAPILVSILVSVVSLRNRFQVYAPSCTTRNRGILFS